MEDELIDKIESLQRQVRQQNERIDQLEQDNQELKERLEAKEDLPPAPPKPPGIAVELQTDEEDFKKAAQQWHGDKKATEDSTQDQGWDPSAGSSLSEQVRSAADAVVSQQQGQGQGQGMVLVKKGLYFDYSSGYYYDEKKAMYYDGHRRVYLKYNQEKQEYDEVKEEEVNSEDAQEEGEIIDLVDSEEEEEEEMDEEEAAWLEERKRQLELCPRDVPPSMRIMVTCTNDPDVSQGSLFLVTHLGGSIGREGGEHAVLLQDEGCSKFHGKIDFKEEKFFLTDLGSRNGTFVNGKRISVAKSESDPIHIGHGTELQIGTTKMKCHVHPGRETCNECEPGLLPSAASATSTSSTTTLSRAQKEKARKQEVKELRKKYSLAGHQVTDSEKEKLLQKKYSDRARKRRRDVGSDHHAEKTEVASNQESIKNTNKGFKMLSKMGWKEGEGLGNSVKGRVEPVQVEQRAERTGLGSGMPAPASDPKAKKKRELWEKTQQRFQNL